MRVTYKNYVVAKCCILEQTLSTYLGGLCLGGHRFQWLIRLLINIKKLMVINFVQNLEKHSKTLKNTGPHSVPLSWKKG